MGAGRRGSPSPRSSPSGARGGPLRRRARDWRPVQHGPAHPGQGGVRRDPPLLPPPHRGDRRPAPPGPEGDRSRARRGGYDEVVLATGVVPRDPRIPGQDHPKVLTYVDVLAGEAGGAPGGGGGRRGDRLRRRRVPRPRRELEGPTWRPGWRSGAWPIRDGPRGRGHAQPPPPARQVHLLQRKSTKPGAGLARTTGWIHRSTLKARKVEMLSGVNYERIDDRGLTISFGKERTGTRVLEVDHVVLCAGQEPLRELLEPLRAAGLSVHVVGGRTWPRSSTPSGPSSRGRGSPRASDLVVLPP